MSKKKKELFVFDFDHTLVHVDGHVYVVNSKTKKRKTISFAEYHSYKLKPNEDFDVNEFEKVVNPIKNDRYVNDMKKEAQIKTFVGYPNIPVVCFIY